MIHIGGNPAITCKVALGQPVLSAKVKVLNGCGQVAPDQSRDPV